MEQYLGIIALWGAEKSGKTTTALTFPRPIVHMDIDVGGYDRAAWRIPDKAGIVSTSYPTPISIEKLKGIQKDGATIRFPKKVTGIKEVWQQIVVDFVEACQDAEVATIIIDSATQLWRVNHRAYLQEVQERQIAKDATIDENRLRESLLPVEYGEPNERMRTLINTARSFKKNLILTHYPTDVWGQRVGKDGIEEYRTGKEKLDGFTDTVKLVDLVIRLDTNDSNQPNAKVTICGLQKLGMTAVGLVLPEASYQGILQLQETIGGA